MYIYTPITALQRSCAAYSLGLTVVQMPKLAAFNSASKPISVQAISGDGNCFFRAVAFILTGSQHEHRKFRVAVVNHMENVCNDNLRRYMATNVNSYVKNAGMNDDGVWATDAEVLGAASLLSHDFVIYGKYGRGFKWFRYPASFDLNRPSERCLPLRNAAEHFEVVLKCH